MYKEPLSEELDCGSLHGDGGKPAILRQADPWGTYIFIVLMDNEQANILYLSQFDRAVIGFSPGSYQDRR